MPEEVRLKSRAETEAMSNDEELMLYLTLEAEQVKWEAWETCQLQEMGEAKLDTYG